MHNDDLSIKKPPPTPLIETERGDYVGLEPTIEVSPKTWEYFRGQNPDPEKFPPLTAHKALEVGEYKAPTSKKPMKTSSKIHALLAPWYVLKGLYYFVISVVEWRKPENSQRRESLN